MDKLKGIRVLLKVVEMGSLSAAAKELCISAPSAVRLLAALEDDVGVRLVNRTTRNIALTEEGTSYVECCKRVLGSLQDVENEISQQHAEPQGSIVVSAPELFGQMHLMPVLKAYLADFPKVSFSVVLSNCRLNLLKENIDFTVRIGQLEDSTLVARKVGEIRPMVVAAPALIEKHPKIEKPEDLARVPCGRFIDGSPEKFWQFKVKGETRKIKVQGGIATNNARVGLDAVCSGLVFGNFLSYQVIDQIWEGRLVEVLPNYEQPRVPISLVYPSNRLLPHRTRHALNWFYDALVKRAYL